MQKEQPEPLFRPNEKQFKIESAKCRLMKIPNHFALCISASADSIMKKADKSSDEYDSPWKEILENSFFEILEFLVAV